MTRPATNPPPVNYVPWNAVTLLLHGTGGNGVQWRTIISQLVKQLDPNNQCFLKWTETSDPNPFKNLLLQLRVHEVIVYNTTGRIVGLAVEDYSTPSRDQLCGVVDVGNPAAFPAVGYSFPPHLRNTVVTVDKDNADSYVYTYTAGARDQVVQYVKMHWRPNGPMKSLLLQAFDRPYQDVADALESVRLNTAATQENTATLDTSSKAIINNTHIIGENTKAIVEATPSTFSRVVNGIASTAALVIPLALADEERDSSSSSTTSAEFIT